MERPVRAADWQSVVCHRMAAHELFLEAILRVSTQPPQGRRSLGGRQIKTKSMFLARNDVQG
jgi:hypothetical protein